MHWALLPSIIASLLALYSRRSIEPNPNGERPQISDKLLDLALKKCEDSKKDLESNLTHIIVTAGILVGLTLGLGRSLSTFLLKDPIFEKVLYLIVPPANLYFFMRLGGLFTVFAQARYAVVGLSQQYFNEQKIIGREFTNGLDPSSLYLTNSYFDHYFRPVNAKGMVIYELVFPLLLGIGHALSLYLLADFPVPWRIKLIIWAFYIIPALFLYGGFYVSMRQTASSGILGIAGSRMKRRVTRAIVLSGAFTGVFLWLLYNVDVRAPGR